LEISPSGVLTFVAGTAGAAGYSGDGGPATQALLNAPSRIALDAFGNLYFADSGNNRIRRVDQDGIISTVAGNGLPADPAAPFPGDIGEGGLATLAQLNAPTGVAVDTAGNLYVSDTSNCRVRKVDSLSGNITTIAGTGQCGYSGDGGPGAAAELNFPHGIALDSSGNLYISDTDNSRVRKLDPTGTITTVAVNSSDATSGDAGVASSSMLNHPVDAIPDNAGNFYIAGSAPPLKLSADGTIAVYAQYAPAAGDLTIDFAGNLYLALFQAIWKVTPAGQYFTIAGSSASKYDNGTPATQVSLRIAETITIAPGGGFYVAADDVFYVSNQGIISDVVSFGTQSAPVDAGQGYPVGLALDSSGNLYISDQTKSKVSKLDTAGSLTVFAGTGTPGFFGDGAAAAGAELNVPQGLAVDADGNLYIADSLNHRVRMVSPQGVITTFAGTGTAGFSGDGGPARLAQMSAPSALTFDSAGNLYIVDSSIAFNCLSATWVCNAMPGVTNQRIRKVDKNGIITTVAGNGQGSYGGDGGLAVEAALCFPNSVAVDGSGNLFILDAGNQVVRMVDTTGTISTVSFLDEHGALAFDLSVDDYAKEGGGIAVDGSGDLFIAAWEDAVVYKARKVSTPYFSNAVNAANFSATPGLQAAPGSLIAIYGLNLALQPASANPPLPPDLGGVSVSIGGIPAPILYVSPSQINVQAPFKTLLGSAAIAIDTPSGPANPGQITVTAAAPAIFRCSNCLNQGMIETPDGNVPAYGIEAAHPGEYVSIYCTGLGDVSNRPADGAPAPFGPPYSETLVTPAVTIGGVPAVVQFSGLAPGYAGLYQVNVLVPENAPLGDSVPVTLSVGTAFDTVTTWIQ
jgi:trimeric autotransporter adhesin